MVKDFVRQSEILRDRTKPPKSARSSPTAAGRYTLGRGQAVVGDFRSSTDAARHNAEPDKPRANLRAEQDGWLPISTLDQTIPIQVN